MIAMARSSYRRFIPKVISHPEVHSRHALTLCRRCAALESEVRKRPFGFYFGWQEAFLKKKMKIEIQVSIYFRKKIYQGQVKCYCMLCIICKFKDRIVS